VHIPALRPGLRTAGPSGLLASSKWRDRGQEGNDCIRTGCDARHPGQEVRQWDRIIGTTRWLFHSLKNIDGTYERYRVVLGKTLLVGLELLVAADIIRTVALDLTLKSIALLGSLVAVRTFLG